MFEEFKGKVLFVTGAASGMGRAVAVRFGSLGCKVAVAARRPDAGLKKPSAWSKRSAVRPSSSPATCPATRASRPPSTPPWATFGSLDYAFNNAGCGADGVHIPFVP